MKWSYECVTIKLFFSLVKSKETRWTVSYCSLMIPPLFDKQEVGIWRVKKRFPRYGVPIWSLWPNIRFLPSIVASCLLSFMHIFRRIFLSNNWWQESDIWSQASYRYAILWEAFLDTSDSYFLFAERRKMCIKINKQEVGIWRVQKRFPRYGVPIWSLWPNIRFLPSIDAEKNATKNEYICSMCIKINKVGKQEVGI
jgi:hypothetical protein